MKRGASEKRFPGGTVPSAREGLSLRKLGSVAPATCCASVGGGGVLHCRRQKEAGLCHSIKER